jgi:hypothetical protein
LYFKDEKMWDEKRAGCKMGCQLGADHEGTEFVPRFGEVTVDSCESFAVKVYFGRKLKRKVLEKHCRSGEKWMTGEDRSHGTCSHVRCAIVNNRIKVFHHHSEKWNRHICKAEKNPDGGARTCHCYCH